MKANEVTRGDSVVYQDQPAIVVVKQLNSVVIDVNGNEISVSYDKIFPN